MLVIVGHGPSIVNSGLGPWLDGQTVVRLKYAPQPDSADWGSRTDYLCARHPDLFAKVEAERWLFPRRAHTECPDVRIADYGRWMDYYRTFSVRNKPSTGLCAIFCAVEFLAPERIGLLGFDNFFLPDAPTGRWDHPRNYIATHDYACERRAVDQLGVKIVVVGAYA